MNKPRNPRLYVGREVIEIATERLGAIAFVGIESELPFIKWAGEEKEMESDWSAIEWVEP